MANIKSQKKRIKTNEKARVRNKMQKSAMRTAIKKLEKAIEEGTTTENPALIQDCYKKIDTAVSKGLIHQNKANRLKSRLTLKLNQAN